MSVTAENLTQKSERLLREFASHQGAAYRAYGEALERYGSGELGAADMVKAAADVYFREAGRFASSVAEMGASLSEMALNAGGVRVLKDEPNEASGAEPEHTESVTNKAR